MTAIVAAPASAAVNLRAWTAYLGFELRRATRNRRYAIFAIGFPVVFYLLYTGVLLGNATPDPIWPAFYMVSMIAYGMLGASLSTAIPIAQERASGWTRQLRITPLPASAWVATKLVVAYVTALPALALVAIAAIVVNHVSLPVESWLTIVVVLALGVLPFTALGLLLGLVFEASAAQGAMTVGYIGLAILGGLWAPVSTFPSALATIATMLPTYHFANLAWSTVLGQGPQLIDALVVAAYGIVLFGLVAWRYRAGERRSRG